MSLPHSPHSPRLTRWALAAVFAVGASHAQELRTNAFDDPFGRATQAIAACPAPAGPQFTAEEARRETHSRAERGTSCFRAGRCRLPNAFLYDKEIFPRAIQAIRADGRFDDTSVWITVQRRWITVEGCVRDAKQGADLEALLRSIDDVEAVIGELTFMSR